MSRSHPSSPIASPAGRRWFEGRWLAGPGLGAIFTIAVCLPTQPARTEPRAGYSGQPIECGRVGEVSTWLPRSTGSVREPMRSQRTLTAILRQIAIYDSIGNRDGAEMLADQLRGVGVSEEDISDARNWTRLHCALPDGPARQ